MDSASVSRIVSLLNVMTYLSKLECDGILESSFASYAGGRSRGVRRLLKLCGIVTRTVLLCHPFHDVQTPGCSAHPPLKTHLQPVLGNVAFYLSQFMIVSGLFDLCLPCLFFLLCMAESTAWPSYKDSFLSHLENSYQSFKTWLKFFSLSLSQAEETLYPWVLTSITSHPSSPGNH